MLNNWLATALPIEDESWKTQPEAPLSKPSKSRVEGAAFAVAVRLKVAPVQIAVALALAVTPSGTGLTVITCELVAVQALLVTVTEYVVVVAGETVIEAVVAPVLHAQAEPVPVAASSVALPVPHINVVEGVMLAVGNGFTVTVTAPT